MAEKAGRVMRESEIQSRILVALCAGFAGRSLFMRINSGKVKTEDGRWVQLAPPGTADIIGTIDGRSVAVECKAARGAQRDTQKRWQAAFEKAGGVYVISRDAGTVCDAVSGALRLVSGPDTTEGPETGGAWGRFVDLPAFRR